MCKELAASLETHFINVKIVCNVRGPAFSKSLLFYFSWTLQLELCRPSYDIDLLQTLS